MERIISLALLVGLIGAPVVGQAQGVEVEVDPLPYVFDGFSVGVGLVTDDVRFDIEVFSIEVPKAMHGNGAFTNRVYGLSIRANYYYRGAEAGWFSGLDLDLTSFGVSHDETGQSVRKFQVRTGVTPVGYKVAITDRLYVKPWIGLAYVFNAEPISIGGDTFEQGAFSPFPALNIGWRL